MRAAKGKGSELRLTLVLGGLDAYGRHGGQLCAIVPPLVCKSADSRRFPLNNCTFQWDNLLIDALMLQADLPCSAAWQKCSFRINGQVGVIK